MVPAKDTTNNSKQDFSYELDHLSTPPHRPISMHIANPVQQPAPINLLEEDDTEEKTEAERRRYKFILSAMTPQEKIHYSAMIEELGGVICDSQYFTLECSHVVVGTPNRYTLHILLVFFCILQKVVVLVKCTNAFTIILALIILALIISAFVISMFIQN